MMLNPLQSHKPATTYTFIPEDETDILKTLNTITFNENDRLISNYKNIDWFSFEAVSIYIRNEKIIGFSTILKRDNYFEKDEVRILNRYYEMPEMRRTSKIIGDDHVCSMIDQQLKISKKLGFKKAFISRDKSIRYFKKFIKNISKKTNTKWNLMNEKVAVCDPKIKECWQWKAYTEL